MRPSIDVIEQIVKLGEGRGLNAADIAERAGISAAALSRARRTGRYASGTLERLLGAIEAKLVVSAAGRPPSPLPTIVKKLNAGRKHHFTTDEIRRLIKNFRPGPSSEPAYSHLVGVIDEVTIGQLHDLVLSGDTSFRSLARIVDYVDGEGPTADWIRERIARKRAS